MIRLPLAGLVLGLVLAPAAVAQVDVVLAPSDQATGCIFEAGAKGLAPLPPGCARGSVSGDPVFTPDGRTLFVGTDTFSRDPTTGALVPVTCDGEPCFSFHYQLLVAPDGRYLYANTPTTIDVLVREDNGRMALVECLSPAEGGPAEPNCADVLPDDVQDTGGIAMPPDGSALYVAGGNSQSNDSGHQVGVLLKFARDAATGRLTLTDCLSEVDWKGCTTDPYLEHPSIVAAVGQDVYVDTNSGIIGFRPYPSTGRLLENRCRGWQTAGRCPIQTDSTQGRPVLPSPDGRWLYGTNGGSIAAWPRDPATGLLGGAACTGPWCYGEGETASLAMSPDGRTLVTTAQNTYGYGSHDLGGRNVPGDGRDSAVFTFRVRDDGKVRFAGCVGNVAGCAMPFGDAAAALYPPSGPGPYLVGQRDDKRRQGIQLLAEAPTVSLRAITFKGANPASVTCPAGRAQACRGTVVLSRLLYAHCCEGGARTPTVTRLRQLRYEAAPGRSASISLRIPAGARAGLRKIPNLDRPYRGVYHRVGMLVEVADATGLTVPTGATVCLAKAPKGLGCEYSQD